MVGIAENICRAGLLHSPSLIVRAHAYPTIRHQGDAMEVHASVQQGADSALNAGDRPGVIGTRQLKQLMLCHIGEMDTHEGGPGPRELAPSIVLEMLKDSVEHPVRNRALKMGDYCCMARTPVREHVSFFETKDLGCIQSHIIQGQFTTAFRAKYGASNSELLDPHTANRGVVIKCSGHAMLMRSASAVRCCLFPVNRPGRVTRNRRPTRLWSIALDKSGYTRPPNS